MSSNAANVLFRRLENQERIIDLMFELPGDTLAMIEAKVFQYQNMIAEIPFSARDEAKVAQAKVVAMWKRIFDAKAASQSAKDSEKEPTQDLVFSVEPKPNFDNNAAYALHLSAQVSTSNFTNGPPRGNFDLQKCQLRYSIENSFDLLNPIESEADMVAIKKLTVEIVQARRSLAPYPQDSRLQFIIFTKAFSKLPLKLREHFFSTYGSNPSGISLDNLIETLKHAIVAHNSEIVTHDNESYLPPRNRLLQYIRVNYCSRCGRHGHTGDDCPQFRNQMCCHFGYRRFF